MSWTTDTAPLQRFLAEQIPGYAGPLEIERFEGGQSNPTYRLSTPTQRYVLRKKPEGVLLKSAHAIEREYRVIAALQDSDVPIAAPLLLCEDSSLLGTPFYVTAFVEGRVLWDPSLPGQTPAQRGAIYEAMNTVMAAIHAVDFRARGLSDFGRSEGYVARQLNRWIKQYRLSETGHIEAMERLIDWLPAHMPASDDASLVHGDYRLDNLMFHPSEPRVLAVLDWELSTIGHPLVDLSYHLLPWRLRPDEFRGLLGHPLAELGIPDEATYLRQYCQRRGVAVPEPEEWRFYAAFNLFRLAAILQGIAKRAQDGTANSAQAAKNGELARGIAEAGWRQIAP